MNSIPTQQPRAATLQVVTFIPRDVQQRILRAVATTRCGDVRVVIQDGEIVGIRSRERQPSDGGNCAVSP